MPEYAREPDWTPGFYVGGAFRILPSDAIVYIDHGDEEGDKTAWVMAKRLEDGSIAILDAGWDV